MILFLCEEQMEWCKNFWVYKYNFLQCYIVINTVLNLTEPFSMNRKGLRENAMNNDT